MIPACRVPRLHSGPLARAMEPIVLQPCWGSGRQSIRVELALAWRPGYLHLHWLVSEPTVLARYVSSQDPVYRDSCVEAFLTCPGADDYCNIECNAIGTVLAARGPDRYTRTAFTAQQIRLIERRSSLGDRPFMETAVSQPWSLEMDVPVELFGVSGGDWTAGFTFQANFYKCGDELQRPHYYAWSAIETERPDFHRPEFFGSLTLI